MRIIFNFQQTNDLSLNLENKDMDFEQVIVTKIATVIALDWCQSIVDHFIEFIQDSLK